MTASIRSERLDLVPMIPTFLRASLARDLQAAERLIGAALPDDWPGEAEDVVALRLEQLEVDPDFQRWSLRAMVLRSSGQMIGHIGFHSAPGVECFRSISPDAAEFGYTVFPAFRRRGYAREASLALMQWATETAGVTEFLVSIRPDNLPSQALAAQLGFVRVGSHIDEVDGLEDILEYRVGRRRPA